MQIRPQTEADYVAAVALINTVFDEGMTVENYAREAERKAGQAFTVLLAEVDGQIVGRAAGGIDPRLPRGEMACQVTVHPSLRRQGIGRALFDALQGFYAEHNPSNLRATVSDEPEVAGWAERRGFRTMHHNLENWLDLTTFDPAAFGAFEVIGTGEAVKAAKGVRLSSFAAEREQTAKAESKLYRLYHDLLNDTPDGGDWATPPEENWLKWALQSPGSWPEGIWLAVTPAGKWVGLTLMQRYTDESRRGHIFMTGVKRAYRGRGLATALKVVAAARAKEAGLVGLTTLNDASNKQILAVNHRLGFQKRAGFYRLIKPWNA